MLRIQSAEFRCGFGGFPVPPGGGQRSRQEELRASIAGIAFQGLAEKGNRSVGSPEQEFGKPAKEEPNAVPSIRSIEVHRALDRRHRLVDAAQKGRIVPGEPVRGTLG